MSVDEAWQRIENWIRSNAAVTFASLRPPATPVAVAEAALALGVELPPDLVASLLRHDGCEDGSDQLLLPGGDRLLSVREIVACTEMVRDLGDDDEESGLQSGWYWHPQYVSIGMTVATDMLVADCRPGEKFGQIGDLFKGDGTTFPEAPDLGTFLTEVADCLEQGSAFRGKVVPVVIDDCLTWHGITRQAAQPTSLLDLAAAAAEPAPQMETYGRLAKASFGGWAGEYTKFCLTFVHGTTPSDLLDRFGAITATIQPRSRAQVADLTHSWTGGYRPTIRVGQCGDWTFAIEEDVWEGAREEVIRRISAGTRLVSIRHWVHPELFCYEDGALLTAHRAQFPTERRGSQPALLTAALERAGLPDPRPRNEREVLGLLCEIASTEFGVTFDTDLLAGELTSAQVLPLLPEVRMTTYRVTDDGTDPAILAATPGTLRTALARQMRSLAAETGLDTYPEVVQALALAEAGVSRTVEDDSPFGLRQRALHAEARAMYTSGLDSHARSLFTADDLSAWRSRVGAGDALRSLLQSTPRVAAEAILPQRQAPTWHAELIRDLTV